MLDFPELFAPARTVSRPISTVISWPSDLKPDTAMRVIPISPPVVLVRLRAVAMRETLRTRGPPRHAHCGVPLLSCTLEQVARQRDACPRCAAKVGGLVAG